MCAVALTVMALAVLHIIVGIISVCVGVSASIQAEIWLAHSVSPIWSGAFFITTGTLGVACVKTKTSYLTMCFTAFCIVSIVTSIVSIQLLRLGLVNHTTDGHTFQKEKKDKFILVALGNVGVEILLCLVSVIASCMLAKAMKKENEEEKAVSFHVQVVGHKDIVVVSRMQRDSSSQKYQLKRERVVATAL